MRFILVTVFLVFFVDVFGQFGIQTGYDFGRVKFRQDGRFINLNRYNLTFEHQFKNNLIIGINTGHDTYRMQYFANSVNKDTPCRMLIYDYDAKVQTIRAELSIGANYEINQFSNLRFKLSLGYFANRKVNVLSSTITEKIFTDGCDEENIPNVYNHNFSDILLYKYFHTDDERILNFLSTLSIEYQHVFNNTTINPYIGFSPFKKPDLVENPFNSISNYYLIGLKVGYVFLKNK